MKENLNKEDMEEYKMHDAREDIPEFDKVVNECLYGNKDSHKKLDSHMEKVIDEATQKLGEEVSKQLNEKLNKKRMKPFNLEAAKAGKSVCTRDGRKARIICFDAKGDKPIIALVEDKGNHDSLFERVEKYFINGHSVFEVRERNDDLMMLPEKKEGWINVYKTNAHNILLSKNPYKTWKEAFDSRTKYQYVDTIKITWEE